MCTVKRKTQTKEYGKILSSLDAVNISSFSQEMLIPNDLFLKGILRRPSNFL